MSPHRTINATWLAMLTLQTIGSIDAKRKLPAPKQYVAISVLWGILFLLADGGLGRLAARLSLLVLLVSSVVGPFGKRLVSFLEYVSRTFAVGGRTGSAPAASAPSVIPGVYVSPTTGQVPGVQIS